MIIKRILKDPKYYTNRVLQKIDLNYGMKISKPGEVWIKITERCNAKCQMCDIWQNKNKDFELSTQDWKVILNGLKTWLGRGLIWFTGGEPFLRKDLLELIQHCHKNGQTVGIISNGILINRDIADKIIDVKLDQLHVSLDSLRPNIHDNLRGVKDITGRLIDTLLYINQRRHEQNINMKLVIKTIIMGTNIDDILPLTKWVFQNNFDEIKFQPIESNLEGALDPKWHLKTKLWPKQSQMNSLEMVINELIRMKQLGGTIFNSISEFEKMKSYFKDPEKLYHRVKSHSIDKKKLTKCDEAVYWLEILSNGDMRMCPNMKPIGNAQQASPKSVWKNRPICWRGDCDLFN